MSAPSVTTQIAASGVATITFDRPDLHNAIDESVIEQFSAGLERVRADPAARLVVIAGNGRSFCAGADLNWMKRTAGFSQAQNHQDALGFTRMLALLDRMPKPTIARVHGPAYGGGVGIVACCDIAIGTPEAAFCFSEVRLGLIPAMISPYTVAVIGERHARRYMLSAERIGAQEAHRLGLLHEVCASEALDARIAAIVDQCLKGGPAAIARTKELIAGVAHGPIDHAKQDYTARMIAATRASEEGREGVGAFLEKRKPAWTAGPRGDAR